MTLDWSFPIGVDLTRDPVVTIEDGFEVRRWPGCVVRRPLQALGEVEASSAMPNDCRSSHGAPQDQVEAILNDLWPQIVECRTAKELGRAIIDAGVEQSKKLNLACLARDLLGATWKDQTMRFWLAPSSHTESHADKHRQASRAWYAVPDNAERAREASRARYAVPENAERAREAKATWRAIPENAERAREAKAAWYAVPENGEKHRENSRYATRGDQLKNYQKTRVKTDPEYALARRLRGRLRIVPRGVV